MEQVDNLDQTSYVFVVVNNHMIGWLTLVYGPHVTTIVNSTETRLNATAPPPAPTPNPAPPT